MFEKQRVTTVVCFPHFGVIVLTNKGRERFRKSAFEPQNVAKKIR